MKAIITTALMALTVSTASAEPDYFSANYVLPGCKKNVAEGGRSTADEYSHIMGFCLGVIYALGPRVWAGCVNAPNGLTLQQEARVVVRYIEARPERMHELFMNLAAEALLNAWPCKK
jgi:hypothetical protein